MKILEEETRIAEAQRAFESSIRAFSTESVNVTIGFQSGNTEAIVHWIAPLGIWAFFGEPPLEKSPGDRVLECLWSR